MSINAINAVSGTAATRRRTESEIGATGSTSSGSSSGSSNTTVAGTVAGAPAGASGSSAASSTSSTAAIAAKATAMDRDTFLKLLVAQLKYQDPSKPVDASEMISQSAQLTVVERLDEISKALTESQATNRLGLAGSMIGKQISFAGPEGVPLTAVVTGVSFDGSSTVLRAGTWDVPLAAVRSISASAQQSTEPTPAASSPD